MPAQYTVGQSLPNGATVTTDTFKTLPDGTTVEFMADSAGNQTTIQIPPAGSPILNAVALQAKATQAITTNVTYIGLASPSTAQNTAQIKALTRQVDALIKLQLGLLDDTSGT